MENNEEKQYTEEFIEEGTTVEYIKELEESYNKLKSEYDTLNKSYLYLRADFENVKRHHANKIAELKTTACVDTVKKIIPVIDDIIRSIIHCPDENIKQGLSLIYHKAMITFENMGIEIIVPGDGKEFDINTMEAVSVIATDNDELKGKVHECIEQGYILENTVIRYAKVVVYQ